MQIPVLLFLFAAVLTHTPTRADELATLDLQAEHGGEQKVYDERGNFAASVEPDPFIPGSFKIYDRRGNFVGYTEPNPFQPRNTRVWVND